MEAESENSVYDELEASRKLLSTMDTLLSGLRGRKLCQEGNLQILQLFHEVAKETNSIAL